MKGFNSIYHSKRANKKKGSGFAIYISETLEYCTETRFSNFSKHLESLFITVTNISHESLTFGGVYMPPSGDISIFHEEFEQFLTLLPRKNVIISGDFNVDLHKPGPSAKFENVIYSGGFIPSISLATHEKLGCSPSCIDNILTNSENLILSSGVLKTQVSAHFPIFNHLNILKLAPSEKSKISPRYDTCQSNLDLFVKSFSQNFSNLQVFSNVTLAEEALFENFADKFSDLVNVPGCVILG